MKKAVWTLVALLLIVAGLHTADARPPGWALIRKAITQHFATTGNVKWLDYDYQSSAPSVSSSGEAREYFDNTGALKRSINGGAFAVPSFDVATNAKGIDADGDSTREISADGTTVDFDPDDDGSAEWSISATTLTGPDLACSTNAACNKLQVYDNEGAGTGTCTAQGTSGRLSISDSGGIGSDTYAVCYDTTNVFNFDSGGASMPDGTILDLSAQNCTNNTDCLKLSQTTDCSNAKAEGLVCWDTDNDTLYVGDGAAAKAQGSGGSAVQIFELDFVLSSSLQGATKYGYGHISTPEAGQSGVAQVLSQDVTLDSLYCRASASPGGTDTWDFTVDYATNTACNSWSSSTITCQISAAGEDCSDVAHTLALTAGDCITFKMVGSATAATGNRITCSTSGS